MPLQNSLYIYRHLHILRWALCDIILENSCLPASIITFRDIFWRHLESRQASKQLASKTSEKGPKFLKPSQKNKSER